MAISYLSSSDNPFHGIVILLRKYSQNTLNNLPMRELYEILFVSPNSDRYGVPVIIMLHLMSLQIRLCVAHSCPFLAATKQLYEWFSLYVCLSVCLFVSLSVCPSHLFDYVPIMVSSWNCYYHWQKWRPCKRSRSDVKGQGHRGQHPT